MYPGKNASARAADNKHIPRACEVQSVMKRQVISCSTFDCKSDPADSKVRIEGRIEFSIEHESPSASITWHTENWRKSAMEKLWVSFIRSVEPLAQIPAYQA